MGEQFPNVPVLVPGLDLAESGESEQCIDAFDHLNDHVDSTGLVVNEGACKVAKVFQGELAML